MPLRASRAIRIVEEEGLSGVIRGALEEAALRPAFSPENPPPHLAPLLGALDRTWHLLEPLLSSAARRD